MSFEFIIGHSRWNTPERFLRVPGCGVRLPCFLPRLGPAAGAAGPFCIQREGGPQRVRSAAPGPHNKQPIAQAFC
jgi:hypothetical protein